MGTRYSAAFYSSAPVDMPRLSTALQQAVDRVDNQMSTWKPESDLCRLNRAPVGLWQVVPPELMTVLVAGLDIGKASGGAFDMGVGDAVDAWGFGAAGPSADQNKIGGAPSTRRPSTDGLELDAPNLRVRKTSAVQLDLSGIAKGFGVDQLAECLERFGITRYFVSIDGEVRASGLKPGGEPWLVGIEKPDRKMRDVARIQELADLALATSGDYRHFREHDGKWVSHTIDPRTGSPVDNAVTSVSVAAQSCMMADAWATALLVLAEVRGPELAEALQLSALFMVRDGDGLREIATGMFRE
ncbi:FAD:protein FMN transferase [Devosia sp.]|uniref:FAD:protein FMN transferase n=1 Tax=Devosia sp. TaxID=1871048 RepID=UPI003BAC6277